MLVSRSGIPLSKLEQEAFHSNPDKEAIYDGFRRVTYRELHDEVKHVASGLSQLGVRKGDRVAVCLPNWHEFIVILFALAKTGAILVPLNTRYRQDEIEFILNDSGSKIAFFTKEFDQINHKDQFLQAKQRVKQLEHIIPVRLDLEGFKNYEQLLELGKTSQPPAVEIHPEEDKFLISYTSGTTGKPKGVMLTHNSLVYNATTVGERMRLDSEDVIQIPSPFSHIHGITTSLQAIAAEAKMVLMEVFKAVDSLRLIHQERITVKCGVPTMYILEMNHPNIKSTDISSLRTGNIVGAPCPVEVVRRIKSEMGCDILVGYGMTEAGPGISLTSFDDDDITKAETVGSMNPGVKVKIVDDDRQEVPVGEVGELAVKSISLMEGYYNQPELNFESFDENGWFYSGDLATIDEKGYIRIVGRKKDVIIRGGFNIYPREIEEIFHTHPAVMDAAIIGLPDSVLGEVPCAAIKLKLGFSTTADEMKSFISNRVADYKVPNHVIFVDNLPTTTSGKIIKATLKDQLIAENLVKLR